MTVTIIGTVTARPESRDELEALLTKQVGPTQAEAGGINYDFHVDAADDRFSYSTRIGEARKIWTST